MGSMGGYKTVLSQQQRVRSFTSCLVNVLLTVHTHAGFKRVSAANVLNLSVFTFSIMKQSWLGGYKKEAELQKMLLGPLK